MKSVGLRLTKRLFVSSAMGVVVVVVNGRVFFRGLEEAGFQGFVKSGLCSFDLAVPYFSRREGQRRASAAWLTSSSPA